MVSVVVVATVPSSILNQKFAEIVYSSTFSAINIGSLLLLGVTRTLPLSVLSPVPCSSIKLGTGKFIKISACCHLLANIFNFTKVNACNYSDHESQTRSKTSCHAVSYFFIIQNI